MTSGLLYVYALRCPSTGDIRYVGKTNSLKTRLKRYVACNPNDKKHNLQFYTWLEELRSIGVKPLITVLSICNDDNWGQAEKDWINFLRESGCSLLNLATGGRGPNLGYKKIVSDDTKNKLRLARQAQLNNPEFRERHSMGVKRWYATLTQEQREHLRQAGRTELDKHRNNAARVITTGNWWKSLSSQERTDFIIRRNLAHKEKVSSEQLSKYSRMRGHK